jgi:prephenate dehydrogenase
VTDKVQITIVGTGCIGTSIGLALRQADLEQPLFIVGHDKDPKHAGAAKKLKAVDKTNWNLVGACEDADILILAIPMNGIEDTMRAVASYLKQGCVITDTASLKDQVVGWADELLPETVSFVGGNPLVASTGAGPDAADGALFGDSLYCITPAPSAHPDAVSLVSSLVSLLGAQPYYLDAAEHDGLIAGAEHLPKALALALASGTMDENSWREMRKLAGGSYELITGLIGEDPDALADLLLANKDNLVRWLDAYTVALRDVRDLVIEGDHEPLAQSIDQAVVTRRQWLRDQSDMFSEIKSSELERTSFMRQMFLGQRRRGS